MSQTVALEYETEPDAQGRAERIRIEAEAWESLPRELDLGGGELRPLHTERLTEEGGLLGCLLCGHAELFTQKDFPRRLGIAIVVVAALLAPFTFYVSLGVAALLDWALYHLAGSMVVCYVCHARHRGFCSRPRHPRFDREIDERLRYGEKAVMGRPMRPGGTADAPEPEH